jgi:hypothetical protein
MFFFFFVAMAILLPRLAQNGWLPVLDSCGTSHVDNKLPQEE